MDLLKYQLTEMHVARAWVFLLILFIGSDVRAQTTDEHTLRAAMVLNLIRFVEWPASARPTNEFRLCVMTDDTLQLRAMNTLNLQEIQGQPLLMQRRGHLSALTDCQAVYLDSTDPHLVRDKLATLKALSVLTIGVFPRSGAMIDVFAHQNRMVFDVSINTLRATGFDIAPRVMELAHEVHR